MRIADTIDPIDLWFVVVLTVGYLSVFVAVRVYFNRRARKELRSHKERLDRLSGGPPEE